MYERMLNKSVSPTNAEILETIGVQAANNLNEFELILNELYAWNKELKFPFGKNYGWGYKYSHKSKHLCYLLFEAGAFTVLIQIGDKEVPKMNEKLPGFLPETKQVWAGRYPCGEMGGWMYYRILSVAELADLAEILKIKCKPALSASQNIKNAI